MQQLEANPVGRHALGLFVGSLLFACSSSNSLVGECLNDSDCAAGFSCRRPSSDRAGTCACKNDESCAAGEVCDPSGACKRRSKCRSNAECEASKFCDVGSGVCIDRTACGSDVHCPPGTVCNLRASPAHCIDGCYSTADCPLYSVCDRSGLSSPDAVGRCIAGRCEDKTFCPFGSRCVNNTCMRDPGPNCAPCDPNSPEVQCGSLRNYCLANGMYDPNNPRSGTPNFCGVECRDENECPNGYHCSAVVLLTQALCMNDASCGGMGRRCIFKEGDVMGACTCASDADCTIDRLPARCNAALGCAWPIGRRCSLDRECDSTPLCATVGGIRRCVNSGAPCNQSSDCLCMNGACFGSRRPCTSAAQCAITCQQGGCLLGATCGPTDGVACSDLQ